jgi:hypothetical protein
MKSTFVVLGLLSLGGCAHTVGVKIDQATYDSFIVGKTTQVEVRNALGAAQMASYNGNNLVEVYSYSHTGAKNFLPGYVYVAGAQIDCLTTSFEYNQKHLLVRKYTNDCSQRGLRW